MRAPSGENAALSTESSCPRRVAISAPVAASQMRAVRSREAVTMRAPSGENAALSTEPRARAGRRSRRRWRCPRCGPCGRRRR